MLWILIILGGKVDTKFTIWHYIFEISKNNIRSFYSSKGEWYYQNSYMTHFIFQYTYVDMIEESDEVIKRPQTRKRAIH